MVMNLRNLLLGFTMMTAFVSIADTDYYVKELTFPEGATVEQKIDMASRLVPDSRQLDWQQLELTAFLHFGINTFTGREWGDGKESPELFNPVGLDAEQWVKTLKDAGFKLVILTAKHHDGFCLWPTKTTTHSVASSLWKNGKGDVVRELHDACNKYGMKMGVYLSPWDRNAECYGDSPRYNDMFVAQLTELLTNYGKIDEVWFDGACGEGPNGKKQEYDWTRFKELIHRLQPNAVTAIMGDDIRWVGNERGQGRETEWSATAKTPGIYSYSEEADKKLGITAMSKDLGGRDIVAKADRLFWWPSEVDVSIRPGWFYHETEQPKSLRELAEIYLTSVGRNSVLLLNIPPDREGLINKADCKRLAEFRKWVCDNFGNKIPGNYDAASSTLNLDSPSVVNTVLLGEDISKGQRVETFDVEALVDGTWKPVASGTTIGYKRILVFSDVNASALRLNVKSSRNKPVLKPIEAYHITLPIESNVNLNGYKEIVGNGWKVVDCSGNISNAWAILDNNAATFWKSQPGNGEKFITIDMNGLVPVSGFVYTPRDGDDKSGTIFHYRFYTSEDGQKWTECPASGEFSNIVNNPVKQKIYFPTASNARYVKLVATDEIEDRDYVTVGDFSVIVKE